MFFLQKIIITVISNFQFIKSNLPTCFFNFYLVLCYFIIRSLVSSHLSGSSSKDSAIINNFFIFLRLFNYSSNSFVDFLCHLFGINNSVFSQHITIFVCNIPIFIHVRIFVLFCFQLCIII